MLSRCEGTLQKTLEKKRNGLIQEAKYDEEQKLNAKFKEEEINHENGKARHERCEKHATRLGKNIGTLKMSGRCRDLSLAQDKA